MTAPNPAIVTQRAAQRLPRIPLLLLCAAYVLPGLFGRDPWKNADVGAFGAMLDLAHGRSAWLSPTIAGVPADAAPLPHWLGAGFIALLSPLADAAFAARHTGGHLHVCQGDRAYGSIWVFVVVTLHSDTARLGSPRRFAGRLYGRQQQGDKNANDGDDNQQLDERESCSMCLGAVDARTGLSHRSASP